MQQLLQEYILWLEYIELDAVSLAVQVMKEVAAYSGRKSESDVIEEWRIQIPFLCP